MSTSWAKGTEVKVLDHGYIKLIDHMGTDEDIVSAARMSTGKGFISWDPYPGRDDGDEGFLEFLLKNNHSSPFEMCELVIEVQAPIFVYREWHRHRTQSYNELSARYTQMPNLHYVPETNRFDPVVSKNKQESSTGKVELDKLVSQKYHTLLAGEQEGIYRHYEEMLERGVPKEVARVNTPVARYSRMRAKTDLLNWLKFLNLRMRPNAQWEIRQYANMVSEIISQLWPRTHRLFEEYMLHAVSFSKTEMGMLKELTSKQYLQAVVVDLKSSKKLNEKQIRSFLEKLT
jgi:thymidylate synthase (FAD)